MRLVLASRNPHKLRELSKLLAPHELVPLPDGVAMPPEDGATFAANALVKARTAAAGTGLPAVADDSGIEAAALGGAPGIFSARYAGEGATDEENLQKLLREVPPESDTRVAYVCALAFVGAGGEEEVVEGRCEGRLSHGCVARAGSATTRPSCPRERSSPHPASVPDPAGERPDDGRALARGEGCDQPPRPGGASPAPRPRARSAVIGPVRAVGPAAQAAAPRKTRAAAISILSNTLLIALKLAAGAVTGSIAIITEAVHSSIDLIAAVIAYFSVRKADEPADEDHPYGHAKIENLSAAIEGMLILVGAGIIVYEATRRLADPPAVESLGVGIAVIAVSVLVNLAVSTYLYRQADATESPALAGDAAHLRTDAVTSTGVLVALVLVEVTGVEILDPIVALLVAVAIVGAGLRIIARSSRVLVDEALPPEELEAVRLAISDHAAPEVAGFHKLRARRAGSRRYVDLHVQFTEGTTLSRAHAISHELQGAIRDRLRDADVLIHLEPPAPPRG